MTERTIRIGMLGCGTVGSAVLRMLAEHGDDIARRADVRLAVTRVAVRDPGRERDAPLSPRSSPPTPPRSSTTRTSTSC